MSMPLFEEIIEKISLYDTIRCVTFHFFNEPTLDPSSRNASPYSKHTVYRCGSSQMRAA
jgi:hypothetical protein